MPFLGIFHKISGHFKVDDCAGLTLPHSIDKSARATTSTAMDSVLVHLRNHFDPHVSSSLETLLHVSIDAPNIESIYILKRKTVPGREIHTAKSILLGVSVAVCLKTEMKYKH